MYTRPHDAIEDVIAYRSRRMLVICNAIIDCSEEVRPSLHPFARWVWCVRYHRGADMYELQLGEGHLVHGVPTGMLHEWKVLPCLPVACMVDRASIPSKRLPLFLLANLWLVHGFYTCHICFNVLVGPPKLRVQGALGGRCLHLRGVSTQLLRSFPIHPWTDHMIRFH